MKFFTPLVLLAACLAFPGGVQADDAADDWKAIVALDAGPSAQPHTPEEARAVAVAQLDAQEKALRKYISQYPKDEHLFEAQLRLVRLLRIRGGFQGSEQAAAESRALLEELSKTATTPQQRTEIDFTRVTNLMVSLRAATIEKREELLTAARKFQADHPDDPRVPALLAETATLFDVKPRTKESLLTDAQRLAKDPEVKGRVTDDLKRLSFLGKEAPLHFTTLDGKTVDITQYRGKVVFVVFFAAWSQPALAGIQTVQQMVAQLPQKNIRVLGVSVDEKAPSLAAVEREYHITWPVGYDPKGWEAPLVRNLGINTLPTVWLYDAKGILRSINALDTGTTQAQLLLQER